MKKLEDERKAPSNYEAIEIWNEIQNNNLIMVEHGTILWPHPLFQDLFVGMEVQSLCFDSMWRPHKEEIFFRFSPLRAKWFGEPWFEYGILMLETVPPDYRVSALVMVGGCNPDLAWQAYLRMEPEYHPELSHEFLMQLCESSLSPGYDGIEYGNFVKTIKYFDNLRAICKPLREIAQRCPVWEGREEALYAIWAKCRPDSEESTIQFVQSMAVTDLNARIRKAALDFLTQIDNDRVIVFLVERLLVETMEVAESLFDMMGDLRIKPSVLTRLQQVVSSKAENTLCRQRALWALGESGTSAEPICELLCEVAREDPESELRRSAVHGLRNFRSRKTLNTLERTLKDANRLVRLASIASLNALEEFHIALILISALADDDGEVVSAASDSLVAFSGRRGAINALARATRCNDVRIRRGAFSVLAIVANRSNDAIALSARRELQLHASEIDKESLLEIATGLIHAEPQLSTAIFKKLLRDASEHARDQTRQRLEELGVLEP